MMKKRGFTLIEVVLCLGLISILMGIFLVNQDKKEQVKQLGIAKKEIVQFIRKIQQVSYYEKKEYVLDIKISNKTISYMDNNGKLQKLELPSNISYMSNNINRDGDFTRSTTTNGNFEKGFSIYLLDKGKKKIYYRVSTNTINSLKYPIISVYKAKKAISLAEDYSNEKLWSEEL